MATFYGTMKGDDKKANNKMGQSKITSHTRTWDHGIEVTYTRDSGDGAKCEIWQTGGSNNAVRIKLIKVLHIKDVKNFKPGHEHYGHVFGGDTVGTV